MWYASLPLMEVSFTNINIQPKKIIIMLKQNKMVRFVFGLYTVNVEIFAWG